MSMYTTEKKKGVFISGSCCYPEDFKEGDINDFTDLKYIPNANYFLINPKHRQNTSGLNPGGSCTTRAVQMLLGYHNYYSDRRIIPASAGKFTFLSDNYGNSEYHPNIKRGMVYNEGCASIGTEDDVFNEIFNKTTLSELAGLGQNIFFVTKGAERFLDAYTPQEVRSKISLSEGSFSSESAYSDLDAGLPIIIGLSLPLELNYHVIPAYGYGTLNGEKGFFVHYGWGSKATQVWLPESWVGYQIRMTVDHEHKFVDTGINIRTTHRELLCAECGYRNVDPLYDISESTIKAVNYSLNGDIIIPSSFEQYSKQTASFFTQKITAIGKSAYENQKDITGISLPSDLTFIDENAFSGCIGLKSVSLRYLKQIGKCAF